MFGKPALLAILLVTIPAVSSAQFGDVFVYAAEQPEQCYLSGDAYDGQVLSVFVESNEYESVTGVRFRVDCPSFGPEHVQSVTTPDGVLITGGDIFSGVTLTFTSRGLHHEPVLYIELAGHYGIFEVWTHDVAILQAGTWESKPDFCTYAIIVDCFNTSPLWFPPDTVDVVIDRDETFVFKAAVIQGGYPPNGMVYAIDDDGWIPDAIQQPVWAGCYFCPWDYTIVAVPVHVPEGVADGTLNPVTFQMLSFSSPIGEKTVVLRAIDPITTRVTTWGRVKALYQ